MDIQGVGPVRALVGTGKTRLERLHPDDAHQDAGKAPPAVADAGAENSTEKSEKNVQASARSPKDQKAPIDFHAGAIENFIIEMDLLQHRVLAPPAEDGSQQSFDTLI